MSGLVIHSIGHSTRSIPDFEALLRAFGIRLLADIRTLPRSRRNPQFNRDSLPGALATGGVGYVHLPRLGGLRGRGLGDASPNTAWRNASFRNYADYMLTPEFNAGLDELVEMAERAPCAMMCAEAVPWRCHRSLVADALAVRGIQVRHILSGVRAEPHVIHPFALLDGDRITYPATDRRVDSAADEI